MMWNLKARTLVAMFEGGDLRFKGLQDLNTKDICIGTRGELLLRIRGRWMASRDP